MFLTEGSWYLRVALAACVSVCVAHVYHMLLATSQKKHDLSEDPVETLCFWTGAGWCRGGGAAVSQLPEWAEVLKALG